jgi:hypothetical protein
MGEVEAGLLSVWRRSLFFPGLSNEINLRRTGGAFRGGEHFRDVRAPVSLGPPEFRQAARQFRGVAANLEIPEFELVIRRNQFQQLAGGMSE